MKGLIAEDDVALRRGIRGGLKRLENRVAYVDGYGNRGTEAGLDRV